MGNPARCSEKGFILIEAADQLNADGQPVRSAMGGKRDGGRMQRRPEFLESRIARRLEALGRLARDRRRISAGDLGCDNLGDPALPKESETLRLECLCN